MKIKTIGLLFIVPTLAACSGGPSDSDIQQALQARERHTEIEKVEQSHCVDAGEGRLRCTYKATVRNGNWVRDRERSDLFERQPSGWAVVRN